MSLFITATGSDIGKTVVCALLAHRYAAPHALLHYWKPVATGVAAPQPLHARRPRAGQDAGVLSDSQTFAALTEGRGHSLPETYRFETPVAPHWAARHARRPISLAALSEALHQHQRQHSRLVVEGIGGVLVPLNEAGETWADWLQRVRLPCVVVAHTGLGTLNHTLLTLEALAHRNVQVAAVVLNGPAHPDNKRSLAAFGKVPIIDATPWMTPLSLKAVIRIAAQFDPDAILSAYLRAT